MSLYHRVKSKKKTLMQSLTFFIIFYLFFEGPPNQIYSAGCVLSYRTVITKITITLFAITIKAKDMELG